MEIAIPADFLSSGENGRLIELELKNLDHERSLIDGEFLTPIRSIEVNALVDGEDGTISFGQAAMLIIPLTTREMEMAGGNLSSLVVFQLNPVTGAWKSLPTLADSGSTPPRLEASLKDFQRATFGVFIIDTVAESAKEGVNQTEEMSLPKLAETPPTRSRKVEGGISPERIMYSGLIFAVMILYLGAAAWITLRKRRVNKSEP